MANRPSCRRLATDAEKAACVQTGVPLTGVPWYRQSQYQAAAAVISAVALLAAGVAVVVHVQKTSATA